MDMKKILQAMDGVSTKPVEGSNDMKKFLSVVTEGANPHKVALPVQMAMQHYQEEKKPAVKKDTLLKKYFAEAEELVAQEQAERKEHLKMYASQVAKRVLENRRYLSYHDELQQYDRDQGRAMHQGRGEIDDESNLMYIYMDGRLKQRMVDNREERQAKAQGFRDTQEAALRVHGIIRSKFNPKKWVQKHGTQWVEVHPFGKPDAE